MTPRLFAASLLAAAAALFADTAAADPGYYVVTIYNDPGLRTVDFRYWNVSRHNRPTTTWPEVGFGWNVNGDWYTEVFVSYIGSSRLPTELSTVNWQNDLLLTHGQYPFDLAIHTQLAVGDSHAEGRTFEFGPALQTDFGRTQVNANVFFERGLGALASEPTQLKYQWQLRHRWRPGLHFGAQGFGELGPWDHWSPRDDQSHRAGPALFGSVPAGPGTIGWQAAYLTGSTYGRHGHMLSLRVKYDY
ncbi:MAG: hypothetical protein JWP29_2835 [Rhodoferax sp.]|nr:hypothetical protein [Rhodoferax sp.]